MLKWKTIEMLVIALICRVSHVWSNPKLSYSTIGNVFQIIVSTTEIGSLSAQCMRSMHSLYWTSKTKSTRIWTSIQIEMKCKAKKTTTSITARIKKTSPYKKMMAHTTTTTTTTSPHLFPMLSIEWLIFIVYEWKENVHWVKKSKNGRMREEGQNHVWPE